MNTVERPVLGAMSVKFSKHAIQRISERFANSAIQLAGVIEAGLLKEWASPSRESRWCLSGKIGHRTVCVVATNENYGLVTVVTAYWDE